MSAPDKLYYARNAFFLGDFEVGYKLMTFIGRSVLRLVINYVYPQMLKT